MVIKMKMTDKIFLYNISTVFFAIMTLVSLGGFSQGVSAVNVVINTAFFGLLCRKCYNAEAKLRKTLKARRRTVKLNVYSYKTHKKAA